MKSKLTKADIIKIGFVEVRNMQSFCHKTFAMDNLEIIQDVKGNFILNNIVFNSDYELRQYLWDMDAN